MPQIGPMEILVVGILALMVFGPEKLPDMARSVGRFLNQVKTMASEAKSEFDMSIDDDKSKSTPSTAHAKASTKPEASESATGDEKRPAAPVTPAAAPRDVAAEPDLASADDRLLASKS